MLIKVSRPGGRCLGSGRILATKDGGAHRQYSILSVVVELNGKSGVPQPDVSEHNFTDHDRKMNAFSEGEGRQGGEVLRRNPSNTGQT